ncbi:cytochrome P450 [Xylariomycetidae sp. FL2044]|nr:cytochrome P450 [Xylariomycetidae sp. FL2044]
MSWVTICARAILQETSHYLHWVLPLVVLVYFAADGFQSRRMTRHHIMFPSVGSSSILLPRFVHNLIFLIRGGKNIQHGYNQFRDSPFQILRYQGSIVVLPHRLLDEVVSLPDSIASLQPALDIDLLGRFNGMDLMSESRLHHTIVQRKLIPNLELLRPRLEESVRTSFSKDLPSGDGNDWIEFQPYHVLKKVSARLAGNLIVGPSLCDHPTWVNISLEYTENVVLTALILRLFPSWMHNVIFPFLPSYWKTQMCLRSAKRLLGPRIQELIDLADAGTWEPREDNVDDLNVLRWLCAQAKGAERNVTTISHILVLVVFASVRNNLFRVINGLYDVTEADPELEKEIVAEITATAAAGSGWKDMPYEKLYRLDSLISESQRVHPPTTLGMRRYFKVPYTFQDGTPVPAGTYTCMATHAIGNDPLNISRPEKFDELRFFRAMQECWKQGDMPGAKDCLFTSPTRTRLNLGFGKSACPGRLFASFGIKLTLVKLFADYEFSFLPGEGRPGDMDVFEFVMTSPTKKMLMRRKENPGCPF